MRSHRSLRLFPVSLICLAIFSIRVLLIAQSEPPISENQSNAISEAQNLRAAELALVATAPPPVSFAPAVVQPIADLPSSVAISDLNGDGHPDLVVVGYQTTTVLLGKGDGTWEPPISYMGFPNATSVAIGDLNGDGRPDLAVAYSTRVLVSLGKGDGTFHAPVPYSSGGFSPTFVTARDVNGDGHSDLVVANMCEADGCGGIFAGEISVLLGNGDGTLHLPVSYSSGGYAAIRVAIGDVNGDGYPDLAVGNGCRNSPCDNIGSVGVLLGNGDGTFQAPVSYSSGRGSARSVAIGDVNGDGHADLAVTGYCGNCSVSVPGEVRVLLGNGNGTFQAAVSYSLGGYLANSVAIGDMNGDGQPDLIVASCSVTNCYHGTVEVLLGRGDGTFQTAISYNSGGLGVTGASVGLADLNGDRRPDIVVTNVVSCDGCGNGNVAVLLNRSYYGSSTKVTSSRNPSLVYQPVTFTATVTPRPFPDGQTVTFYDGTIAIGSSSIARGVASFSTHALSAKTHTIKARYSGNVFEKASSGTVTQVVNRFPTTTTLTSSLNPSTYGQRVSWIAKVNTSGTILPTGTVAFTWSDGFRTYTMGSAILSANGIAILTKSNLNAADQFPLIALYKGDANNAPSSSPVLSQTVLQTTSTAAITSSTNPSTVGQAVTFTAKFTSPTVIPSGPVTFKTGTTVLGTAQLTSGKAIFTTSTLPAGSTVVKVIYNGNSNIKGSSASVTQTVQP